MRVLIIEDDPDILDFLVSGLPERGFVTDGASTGAKGLSLFRSNDYDLVILDLNLPDMTGEAVIKEMVRRGETPPILMLTVVYDTETKVRLLNAGADDYLCKPFSFDELVSRVRALLRRSKECIPAVVSILNFTVDFNAQSVKRGEKSIPLTKKEFGLFEYLLRQRGEVVSKESLLEHLWDSRADLFIKSLEVHMSNLRRKLGTPSLIHTLSGRGYIIR